MDLINKYTIITTVSFIEDLNSIIYYFNHKFKEPNISEKFYLKIIKNLSSLSLFPERYPKISNLNNINLRKLIIDNYVIIYETNHSTKQVFILHIFHSSQNYLNLL